MGQILDILRLPWREREQAIRAISGTKPLTIWSPESFKVKFQGEIVEIKKGLHQYAPHFAIWALDKYGPHSTYGKTYRTEVVDEKQKQVPNPTVYDEPQGQAEKSAPTDEIMEMSQEPKRRGRN